MMQLTIEIVGETVSIVADSENLIDEIVIALANEHFRPGHENVDTFGKHRIEVHGDWRDILGALRFVGRD